MLSADYYVVSEAPFPILLSLVTSLLREDICNGISEDLQ
jgi:hypothetical protein